MPDTSIIQIEQGPRWLVEFFMNPPWWFKPSVLLLGITVAALVGYRLHQRGWRISPGQQRQMLEAGGLIVAIMTGVLAMANYTSSAYLVDVGAGFLVGYGSIFLLGRVRVPLPYEGRQRLTAAWVALAVCAFILPVLAALNGKGTLLGASRYYLAVLGVAMAAYNEYILEEVLEAT